jgi:MtrB/PioB family decaheme-associated outer membrane protein
MKRQPMMAAAVLATLLALAGSAPAAAQEEGSQGFSFKVDPLVIGILETDVDTDSAKFQEYRDLGSGFLGAFDIDGQSADGNRTFSFTAEKLGRDDARYTMDYGVSGRYGLFLDYNKIPHRFGNGGRMLHSETRPGVFEIADPVQAQIQGAVEKQFATNRNGVTFAFLDALLAPYLAAEQGVSLGLRRDRTLARLELGSLGHLAWQLEYNHENRSGNRPVGASFGFNNVNELPEPIEYDTTNAQLAAELNGARGGLRFGYRYSTFENDVSTLIWDNPFRAVGSTDPNAYSSPGSGSVNGSARGFYDLAADNKASFFFADGRTRFGSAGWASASLSYTTMTQDEPLLPYTLNTSIQGIDEAGHTFDPTNPANLPARHADREADVLSINGDAGTRFGERLSLTFRYRYYDYDNQSPRIEFPGYVRFHAVWEAIPRITVPYAYTRQDLGAELDWELPHTSSLGLAYRHQIWDREFREVDSSDEDVVTLSFDSRPTSWVNLRASYELGDRSIDHYDPEAAEASFVEPEGVSNLPALRKYDEAARQYDQVRVAADFFPSETWTFTVGVSGRDEDFDESAFGLLGDELVQYNAEVSYTPGEKLTFYLFGQRAEREVEQLARQSGATPSTRPIDDWALTLDENNDTWGLGVTSHFAPDWTVDVSGNWTKSDGSADFFASPGGLPLSGTPPRTEATDFGNYEDIELLALSGRLDYRIAASATFGFLYRYEDYTIDSFILQDLRNYLPGALLLNANNGDYQANLFAVDLRLVF